MKPYVLKHGSPDMSCVVMTTCKGKHKVNRVTQKHSWIGLDDEGLNCSEFAFPTQAV